MFAECLDRSFQPSTTAIRFEPVNRLISGVGSDTEYGGSLESPVRLFWAVGPRIV